MKRAIFITAVSGSGKSTLCGTLKQLGYCAYDIEDIPDLFSWKDDKTGEPIGDYHDDVKLAKSASWICDTAKLTKIIANEKSELTFYCGAGSNINEMWDLFDTVILLQVSDATTVTRLSARRPDQYGHTPEVRDYVLSWKDDVEKEWLHKGGIPVSAEDSPEQVALRVVAIAEGQSINANSDYI